MTGITGKLCEIQHSLKAPKGQRNTFGRYNYRSCEDILEAVKPLLHDAGLVLTLSDDITEVGGRVYVKSTATLTDGTDTVTNTAYAREAETKKGMDESQITGTASSYARKYALNGLFCIDDTRDADTDEYHARTHRQEQRKDPPAQVATCEECGKCITAMTSRNGRVMQPADFAEWTRQHTGKAICGDCYQKWKQAKAQELNTTQQQTNNN